MLNLLFCGLLFATVSYMGNLFARQVEQRPKALADLRTALDTLKTRLHYYNEPVQAALANTSKDLQGDFRYIFEYAAEQMVAGETAEDALRLAMRESGQRGGAAASLLRQDMDIIDSLARRIGGDTASQSAAFGMAFAMLEGVYEQAEQQKQARSRLYRTSGILTGALLAIIFI